MKSLMSVKIFLSPSFKRQTSDDLINALLKERERKFSSNARAPALNMQLILVKILQP